MLTVSRHPDPEKGELSYAEAVSSGAQIVVNTAVSSSKIIPIVLFLIIIPFFLFKQMDITE